MQLREAQNVSSTRAEHGRVMGETLEVVDDNKKVKELENATRRLAAAETQDAVNGIRGGARSVDGGKVWRNEGDDTPRGWRSWMGRGERGGERGVGRGGDGGGGERTGGTKGGERTGGTKRGATQGTSGWWRSSQGVASRGREEGGVYNGGGGEEEACRGAGDDRFEALRDSDRRNLTKLEGVISAQEALLSHNEKLQPTAVAHVRRLVKSLRALATSVVVGGWRSVCVVCLLSFVCYPVFVPLIRNAETFEWILTIAGAELWTFAGVTCAFFMGRWMWSIAWLVAVYVFANARVESLRKEVIQRCSSIAHKLPLKDYVGRGQAHIKVKVLLPSFLSSFLFVSLASDVKQPVRYRLITLFVQVTVINAE